jgi:hypothetical protein
MIFFHYCVILGFRFMEINMNLLPKRNIIPSSYYVNSKGKIWNAKNLK